MKRESPYPYLGKGVPGTTIHHLRKLLGLSLREVAARCGLDHTSVRRLELNNGYTQDSLKKVAKVLGVEVEVLFCPPAIAEVFWLPKPVRTEVFLIIRHAVNVYRKNGKFVP